jgi:F0F1-type ATP synthase epsilon subunit
MSNIKLSDLTELLTVNPSNTILFATDLSVSPNVSHYVRSGTLTQTDYALANAAFLKANIAFSTGSSANLALLTARLAYDKSNLAYSQATTGTNLAQAAYNQANVDFIHANSAFNKSNSVNVFAQSAYNQANTDLVLAQSAFDKANSDFVHANSAFNLANSINNSSSTNLAQAAFDKANSDFVHANSAFNKANSNFVFITSGYNQANSAYSSAISGTVLAQSAFDKANSDQILAQSAYNQANTASNNNGTSLAQAAYNQANTDLALAQAAYNQANTSYFNGVSAFSQANTGVTIAGLAFNKANNALPLTGGTLSGTLNFSGTGRLITGDFGDSVIGNRPLFQSNVPNSNTDIMAAPSGTAVISGFTAFGSSDVNNCSYGNFWQFGKTTIVEAGADGTGSYGNLILATQSQARVNIAANGNIYTTSPLYLASDPTTDSQAATKHYVDNLSNTVLAQAAFDKANSDQILAQSAYNQANTASNNNLAQAAYNQANTDLALAQAAYNQANTSYYNGVASFIQANTGVTTAGLAFNKANNALPLTGGTLTGNLNFSGDDIYITGNFGDSHIDKRPVFQSNTPNSNTDIIAAPTGTAVISGFTAFGSSDLDNSSYGNFWQSKQTTIVEAGFSGTGSYGNLVLVTQSQPRVNVAANGNIYCVTPVYLASDPTTDSQAATKHYVDVSTSGGLGVGQTWQNLTSSRQFNQTYTNATGKPIMVMVMCPQGPEVYVGDVYLGSNATAGNDDGTITFIVPNGQTYRCTNGGTLQNWAELR